MKPDTSGAAYESGARCVPALDVHCSASELAAEPVAGPGLRRLLTAQEIADFFGVSRAWVLAHANGNRRPRLPRVKLGKVVRFEVEAVKRFLQECAR
jgi:predicted DNA-binding transcriptional regulator AlpA